MKKLLVTIVAALLVAPFVASQSFSFAEEECPDVATDLLVEARKSVRLADMTSFQKVLDEKDYDLVIDVREPVLSEDRIVLPGVVA